MSNYITNITQFSNEINDNLFDKYIFMPWAKMFCC